MCFPTLFLLFSFLLPRVTSSLARISCLDGNGAASFNDNARCGPAWALPEYHWRLDEAADAAIAVDSGFAPRKRHVARTDFLLLPVP